jgi:hypothetical protein
MNIPQISFPHGLDEKIAFEAEQKGYWGRVTVRLSSGREHSVCFYDPVTLSQNLKIVEENGGVCIGEPGLIVIPSVTLHYMQEAVNQLFDEGYFEYLSPLTARIE